MQIVELKQPQRELQNSSCSKNFCGEKSSSLEKIKAPIKESISSNNLYINHMFVSETWTLIMFSKITGIHNEYTI